MNSIKLLSAYVLLTSQVAASIQEISSTEDRSKTDSSRYFNITSKASEIAEIHSFAQIVDEIDEPEALIFIDIDDTLVDFDMHIGSKQWRTHVKNSLLKNDHDNLTLHIARQIPMVAVEKELPTFISKLQRKGRYLFPLTARERDCWYDLQGIPEIDEFTYQTLLNAQFDFEKTARPPYFHHMNQDHFYRGIYFSKHPPGSDTPKGDTIKKLLAPMLANVPSQKIKVYFIDDKREQCESVLSAIKELGITGRSYWYRACERNHEDFDFAASLIQLEKLIFNNTICSNFEAAKELIARGNPAVSQLIECILQDYDESISGLGLPHQR